MPLDLSRLVATVAAYEEQRKQLEEDLLAHRLAVVDAAVKEVNECDGYLEKLGISIPPSPFAENDKPRRTSKKKPSTALAPEISRRGIKKEAMWKELQRFFQENGPLTKTELWDLAEDHCDKEGITLGVRMVFDRTVNDPKFAKEFCDLFKQESTAATTITLPHSTDATSI